MKIAVDIDEVLCEFVAEFLKWYNQRHGTDWTFNDVTDYHWPNFMNAPLDQLVDEAHEFFKTDMYHNLPLVRGAREGIADLAKEHRLCAVTGRQNILKGITLKWLDENFPKTFEKVEFTNNYAKDGTPPLSKGDVCKNLECEVLIDDDTRYVEPILDNRVKLILFNKPWNAHLRMPPSIRRANNWPEIISFVKELKERDV